MDIKGIVYNLFFKRFKEKDYLLGEKSVLYETASIINNLHKKEKIGCCCWANRRCDRMPCGDNRFESGRSDSRQ